MPVALLNDQTVTRSYSDASDVSLAASGDRRAFERLYRANTDRVFSICARMVGDGVVAEELTQDVFVRAWEKLSLYRGESAFSTWLHRLAVNVVLNARKTDGRLKKRFGSTASDGDDDPGMDGFAHPGAGPMAVGDRMDIEAAIATLPPGAKRVFILHDIEGYKHEEIASMLGVTSGGSKAQLHRARMLLREKLNR